MIRKLLVAISAVGLLASCASKKKAGDDAGNVPDSKVTNQDMSFDLQGSDSGKIAGLNTVYFEYDQARLTSEARRTLAENAAWVKGHPGASLQIEGHTDERGSIEYNLALGERRARAVKDYMTSLGVDGKMLTIISYGEEKPLMKESTEAAFAKNRRANFVPLGK